MTDTEESGDVQSLEKLSFVGRGLKLNEACDAEELVTELDSRVDKIYALEMGGNTLGIPAAEVLGKALEKHQTLTHALWSDMFTGRMKTEIAPALKHLSAGLMLSGTHLVELDLSDNAFGPNGIIGVTDLLASPTCHSLKILRLNNNGLGHQGCRHLVEALHKGHDSGLEAGQPLSLRVFVAGRNRLENVGAELLAGVFSKMTSLECLSLPQNGIGIHGEEGVAHLVEALSNHTGLKELNLSDNSLKLKGAKSIAGLLPVLTELKVLNLNDCLLRSSGVSRITEALSDETTTPELTELHLTGNEIRRSAAIELALAVSGKKQLTCLDLNTNELGDSGKEALRQALKSVEMLDALGSLSDDEGSEDEEDEEEEEDEDHVDHEGEDYEDEEEATSDSSKGITFNFKPASDLQTNKKEDTAGKANPFAKGISFDFKQGLPEAPKQDQQPVKPGGLFASTLHFQPPSTTASSTNRLTGGGLFANLGSANTTPGKSDLFSTLTSPAVAAASPGWDDDRLSKALMQVLRSPDDAAANQTWSSVSVKEELATLIDRALGGGDVEDQIRSDPEAATRVAFRLSSSSSQAGEHILKSVMSLAPRKAANASLVELGLIKGEDRKLKPICNPAGDGPLSFGEGVSLVRGALTALPESCLPRDVAFTLATVLRHQPEKRQCHQESSSEVEALLGLMEKQMSGLNIDESDEKS